MPHRVSCPEFVGRTEELDLLCSILGTVRVGRSATVLVAAMPASGSPAWWRNSPSGRDARRAGGDRVSACPSKAAGCRTDLSSGSSATSFASQATIPRRVPAALVSGVELGVRAVESPAERYSAVRSLADELAKTRLFESILTSVLGVAEGRRSCWSSRTCSGPTLPARSC